jgi:transposase
MVAKRLNETLRRRLRAGRLLLGGKTPAQAAHAVGVARQTAPTWKAVLDEGGIDALRAIPGRGRPARAGDD